MQQSSTDSRVTAASTLKSTWCFLSKLRIDNQCPSKQVAAQCQFDTQESRNTIGPEFSFLTFVKPYKP
eukprot:500465-Amphidinium_carterae.2